MTDTATGTIDPGTRVLVLANGRPPGPRLWAKLAKASGLIACVDGGANAAVDLKARPDVIYGDFDSVKPATREAFLKTKWKSTKNQEHSDLDKALSALIERGARAISVAGAMGRRADHALANIGLLLKYCGKASITFHDRREDLFALLGEWTFEAKPARRVSLLPMFGPARVTTEGLMYPLRGEMLEMGIRDGLSNQATGGIVRLIAEQSPLLVCIGRKSGEAPLFAPPIAK